MSEGGVTAVEEALRIHPTWTNGGGDLPGPGGSVIAAMLAVASGLCRHVLCFRTVWESTYRALGLGRAHGRVGYPGFMEWRAPYGAMSAANWIGMNANQYFHRYGATREMLGMIAVNGRTNAGRNPVAIYREPMTMDDYLAARLITTPVRALRLRRALRRARSPSSSRPPSVAGDLPHPAIRIERWAPRSWSGCPGTRARSRTSRRCSASRRTCGPAPTCDRPTSIWRCSTTASRSTRSPGWKRSDSAGSARRRTGWTGASASRWTATLPVNPHGGQLSEGRTHGYGFIYEAVTQLRHDAGERQVADAQTAVVTSGGGTPSGVLLLQRDGS